ncbi:MAG TPA: cysteine--tRNA ligase [Bdellovibrionota bacterium]|nr:cysteine--tRNA ligase [Bdellovibrionota bacterium]
MALRIYNSMTGEKEEFIPLKPKTVGIYWCGVTVYDLIHIGHTRAFIILDMIVRYFQFKGYSVTSVRNHTDIDDKIINRAKEKGMDALKLAEENIKFLEEDCRALNLAQPTFEPRATQHIPEMISMIQTLIEKGHAYAIDGDVYYRVRSFPSYGKLSKKNIEELEVGARIAIDERKEDALDFALWKASKPGEPSWESPWGGGRPGWHIECSCMSQKYLGETFDIHGGGRDLIFPHHENEIAQSEATTGKTFARLWIHNGLINLGKEKMSKSLGNIITTRNLLKKYPGEVLRFFILSSHYRSPIDFSEQLLNQTVVALERLYETRMTIQERLALPISSGNFPSEAKEAQVAFNTLKDRFLASMDDDFNSAAALGYLFEFARLINRWINLRSFKLTEEGKNILQNADRLFLECGEILGLLQGDPKKILSQLKICSLPTLGITEEEILKKISEREQARKQKDFHAADQLRSSLLEKSIILEDRPEGTQWKIKREL